MGVKASSATRWPSLQCQVRHIAGTVLVGVAAVSFAQTPATAAKPTATTDAVTQPQAKKTAEKTTTEPAAK